MRSGNGCYQSVYDAPNRCTCGKKAGDGSAVNKRSYVIELNATNKQKLNDTNKELLDANEELQVSNEELVLTHEELLETPRSKRVRD
jgi:hypothetical protein